MGSGRVIEERGEGMDCDKAAIRRIPFDPTEPGLYTKGAFDIRERKRLRRVL